MTIAVRLHCVLTAHGETHLEKAGMDTLEKAGMDTLEKAGMDTLEKAMSLRYSR